MPDDAELLRRFANEGTEAAFAEFVGRYVDFVYGCSLRRLGGDVHAAKDVTQQVFVAAARQARTLATHPAPSGWLYTAARNIAAQFVRSERRRQVREQEAQQMNEQLGNHGGPDDWEQIRPVLDDALDELNEKDRQAVLWRFFEAKSFAEIGARLQLADSGARMRVERALDKLQAGLARRGVTSTAAALALIIGSQATVAAPVGLATAATGAAVAGVAGGAVGTAAIFMGMTKLQVAIAAALVVGAGSAVTVQVRENAAVRRQLAEIQSQVEAGAAVRQELRDREATRAAEVAAAHDRAVELIKVRAQIDATYAELRRYAAVSRPKATTAGAPPSSRSVGAPGIPLTVSEAGLPDGPPKPMTMAQPQYPFELRRLGIPGEATVDLVVDAQGRVQNAYAISGTHPAIADAAVTAVQQWTFAPGRKGGKPIPTHTQVPIVFQVSDDDKSADVGGPSPASTMPSWF